MDENPEAEIIATYSLMVTIEKIKEKQAEYVHPIPFDWIFHMSALRNR